MGQFMHLPVELLAVMNRFLWWEDVLSLDVALQRNRLGNHLFLENLPNVRVRTLLYGYKMCYHKSRLFGYIYPDRLRLWREVRPNMQLVAIIQGSDEY